MMNVSYTATCSCPNQHYIAPGEICEICSGIITEENQLTNNQQGDESFGRDYFEALEFYLEVMIHAA